jgi:hypothetical protein
LYSSASTNGFWAYEAFVTLAAIRMWR